MPKIKHHRSSRRAPPPKDSDFDHEIGLVDHSAPAPLVSAQDDDSLATTSLRDPLHSNVASEAGPSSPQRSAPNPDATDIPKADAQDEAPSDGPNGSFSMPRGPSVHVEQPTPQLNMDDQPIFRRQSSRSKPKTPESTIDILYENQRGGFLCGMPLFSSKALGNLDPPPWTNYAHHASPTDITNAQVPDPSWEWVWPEWRINHDDGVDEDGWEYSFMFSKKFSWHKASWWNSFVRRRAWIRKRVKKDENYMLQDPHMLNPDYFSVRPSSDLSRERSLSRDRATSRSRTASHRGSRQSMSTGTGTGTVNLEEPEQITIQDVETLLLVLRRSRIDREKIEAIDNYLEHAEEDLEGLQEVMHETMSIFVFQASRRALMARFTQVHDVTVEQQKKEDSAGLRKRAENLEAAIKHADEEVKRLEYWSDVKGMAEGGESMGAVDQSQGWDPSWRGLDKSGPAEPAPPTSKQT
ncbi:hypothetical protein B0T17DRAFT_497337 [Bombardia bombarda]|uniref:Meiotically up-regulated 65 protein n=1 Tax=Bombardia bombarda TaxID=252184 RepID=A0AA39WI53_9PEZI|nr:hypothetical protein B0T17DRAFT_497337 [Bombardia bombarda]